MLCLEFVVFPLAAAWSITIFEVLRSLSRVCLCGSSKDFPASQRWHQDQKGACVAACSCRSCVGDNGASEILVRALAHVSTSTSFVPVGADQELSPRLSITSIPWNARTRMMLQQVGPNTAYLPIAVRCRTNITGLSQSATWKSTLVSLPCMPLYRKM